MKEERRVPKYSSSGSLILKITTLREQLCVSKSLCWDFSTEKGQSREQEGVTQKALGSFSYSKFLLCFPETFFEKRHLRKAR